MHDASSTPEPQATQGGVPPGSSTWTRLPGCSMQASFNATDTLQDVQLPAASDISQLSPAGATPPGLTDSRWCNFGHWNATRCAVMGAGARGVSGGARMHQVEVTEALLLCAWRCQEAHDASSGSGSVNLHEVELTIGFHPHTVRKPSAKPSSLFQACADARTLRRFLPCIVIVNCCKEY
jgi:hypothetical protein